MLSKFVSNKLSTQKLAYAGGAAAVLGLIVGGLFGWQQIQLISLNRQWGAIATQVTLLKDNQAKIQKYRPWFDDSCRALTIWAKLTQAQPVLGSVSVKTIEIRDLSSVSAHGNATSLSDFNVMREALGRIPGVKDLHADTSGQPPQIQYNLTYQWDAAAAAAALADAPITQEAITNNPPSR